MVTINRVCTYGWCNCPIGTHAWNALSSVDEHMIPHDPGSKLRAERLIRQNEDAVRDIRRQMGRDEVTGEPWRKAQIRR